MGGYAKSCWYQKRDPLGLKINKFWFRKKRPFDSRTICKRSPQVGRFAYQESKIAYKRLIL